MKEKKETKRVVADIPAETHDALKRLAAEHDRSVASMIQRLVAVATGVSAPLHDPVVTHTQIRMPHTDEERRELMEKMQ